MWFSDELPDELDELWPRPLDLSEVDAIRLDTVLAADFAVHRRRRLPYWSKPATVEPPPDDDDPEDFKPWPHDPGPSFGWAAEAPLALVCALVRSWEERLGARVVAGFGSALTERLVGRRHWRSWWDWDHSPNHCSAPHASYRPTSVKPSFAARRIERVLAVWVQRTTGLPGSAAANQASTAPHASAA